MSGCANSDSGIGSNNLTTSSVTPAAAPKIDPACYSLASQIDGLRKDGIADKIEKASAKKYKMTAADLGKANELNKANADFQTKCSVGPKPTVTQAAIVPATAAPAATTKPMAKTAVVAKPKIPAVTGDAVKNVAAPAAKDAATSAAKDVAQQAVTAGQP